MRPGTGRSHPTSRIVRSAIVLSRSCHARRRTCAKASRLGKRSFVRQRQSSIKKDTTALHFPISCEPPVWKKAGFTGTLRAKKSLQETPSTTPGKLQWTRASKEQRRSRIPLIASTLEGSIMVSRLQKKEEPRDLAVRHLEEYLETQVRARKSKAGAAKS